MSSCTQQVEYCTLLFPLFTPVATSGVYLTAEAIYKGMAKTGEFRFCKKTLSSCRVDSYTLLPREHRHLGLIEQFGLSHGPRYIHSKEVVVRNAKTAQGFWIILQLRKPRPFTQRRAAYLRGIAVIH